MKKCNYCGTVNEDWARYCNYCGKPLIKTHEEKEYTPELEIEKPEPDENKIIKIGYVISIIFGWGWVPLIILNAYNNIGFFGFFGLFLPFYMINSNNSKIRKHGLIQLMICLSGFLMAILVTLSIFRFI